MEAQQQTPASDIAVIITTPEGRTISSTAGEALRRVYGPSADLRGSTIRNGTLFPSPAVMQHLPPATRKQPGPVEAVEILEVEPGPVVTMTGSGGVSAVAVSRIQRHEELLASVGIALPPPVYAAGTRVNSTGEANFTASREAWEDLPELYDAAREVAGKINAEDRADVVAPWSCLTMDDAGALHAGSSGPIYLEEQALRQLVTRAGDALPKGYHLLRAIDPDLRAATINRQLGAACPDGSIVLRTRSGPHGQRQGFAIVSEGYTQHDAHLVLRDLAVGLRGQGYRAAVTYDPATTSLDVSAVHHVDRIVDAAAGDVFKVGFRARSNDAGGGAIRIDPQAWRNLCLNLIIIGTGQGAGMRVIHRGSMDRIPSELRAVIARVAPAFDRFAEEWHVARGITASEMMGFDDADFAATVRRAAELGASEITGIDGDALEAMLRQAHACEPGPTGADIVNAITRAAHGEGIGAAVARELETWAGRLIERAAARYADRVPAILA